MKSSALCMSLVLLAWALGTGLSGRLVAAQCPATFFSALVQLLPCRPAAAPFSPAPPSQACCNAVRTLGRACLCALVNGPPIIGVDVNIALQLPNKCTINFEPCNNA